MEKTNRDYANDIEDALRDGLMDAVLDKYTEEYGGSYWEKVEEITMEEFKSKKLEFVKKQLDISNLLYLIKLDARLFHRQKQREPKLIDYTMQLTKLRNGNSHNSPENEAALTDDEIQKQAFAATRLLEAFDTKESRQAAETTRRIREIFLSRIAGETEEQQTMPGEQKAAKAPETAEFEAEYRPGLMQQMQAGQSDKRPSHDDSLIQSLMQQNKAMMQMVQNQSQPPANQPVININANPNVNPNISANISSEIMNNAASTANIAERNDAAFVAGVLIGLIGFMGVAHIFNHKLLRGLVYLIVGSVLYWILLLVLAAILNTLKLSLLLLLVVHVAIVWQQAKHGAGRRPSNTKAKRATL